ncbi:MAG TPA: stage III sporulation protein AB [Candidatus Pullilachnospira intestinigallinarum]|nr:stage III sporulation protein AB [Candidatus Pullilachnospira intestinigallinarum]
MIRMLGAVLLAASCAGLGILESLRLKKRIEQLRVMIRIAAFLEGEISFARTTLPEALRSVGGRLAPPFSEFLQDLAAQLERCPGKSFGELLRQSARGRLKGTELREEDLEAFFGVASDLGYLDGKMQVHILQTYQKEQEEKVGQLAAELPAKQKLFRSLGILGGIFLVILLL